MDRILRSAYFAGIIDGEGSISYQSIGASKGMRYVIEVKMTCERTIRALHSHFQAGHVITRLPANPRWKRQWRWRVTTAAARKVYAEIKPFLITKAGSDP